MNDIETPVAIVDRLRATWPRPVSRSKMPISTGWLRRAYCATQSPSRSSIAASIGMSCLTM